MRRVKELFGLHSEDTSLPRKSCKRMQTQVQVHLQPLKLLSQVKTWFSLKAGRAIEALIPISPYGCFHQVALDPFPGLAAWGSSSLEILSLQSRYHPCIVKCRPVHLPFQHRGLPLCTHYTPPPVNGTCLLLSKKSLPHSHDPM